MTGNTVNGVCSHALWLIKHLCLIRFTDQKNIQTRMILKQNSMNEQNKTKQSEVKEHYGKTKDNVYTNKLSILNDICTCMFDSGRCKFELSRV